MSEAIAARCASEGSCGWAGGASRSEKGSRDIVSIWIAASCRFTSPLTTAGEQPSVPTACSTDMRPPTDSNSS